MPKKGYKSVAERERQVVGKVPVWYRENLDRLINDYCQIFSEKLPEGVPTSREVQQ